MQTYDFERIFADAVGELESTGRNYIGTKRDGKFNAKVSVYPDEKGILEELLDGSGKMLTQLQVKTGPKAKIGF